MYYKFTTIVYSFFPRGPGTYCTYYYYIQLRRSSTYYLFNKPIRLRKKKLRRSTSRPVHKRTRMSVTNSTRLDADQPSLSHRLTTGIEMRCEPCDLEDCPICLYSPSSPRALGCSHVFCLECLVRHLERSLRCPLCAEALHEADAVHILEQAHQQSLITAEQLDRLTVSIAEWSSQGIVNIEPSLFFPSAENSTRAQRAFERWARSSHVKCCPSCQAPIMKNGGCNNMRCTQCNASFNWALVPLLCPCRGVHYKLRFCFAKKCPDNKSHRLSYRSKLELSAAKGTVLACTLLAYAPIIPIGLVVLGVVALAQQRSRLRRQRRRPELSDPKVRQALHQQLDKEISALRMACRMEGHALVLDWCSRCGHVETSEGSGVVSDQSEEAGRP